MAAAQPALLHGLEAALGRCVCPLHHMVALDATDVQTGVPTQPVPVGLRLCTFTNRCAKLPYGSTTGHSRSADRCDLLKQPAHLHLYLPAGVAGLESVSMNISKDFLTLLVLDKRMYIESHC